MNEVLLSLHGVGLRLQSPSSAFAQYVRTAMQPFLVDDLERDAVTIRSRMRIEDSAPPKDLAASFPAARWTHRPDRDLYVGDGCAYWTRIDDFPELKLAATFGSGVLSLDACYHFQIGRETKLEGLRRLRYARNLDALRARRFSTLLYYSVYHPLLWWLSRHKATHAVHGGAVAFDSGAIALAGMPGCGKSSLCLALMGKCDGELMSDNIVLHDDSGVLACPELLLVDERSVALAGGPARLETTGERRVYGRDAYRPSRYELGPKPVAAWVQVERGETTGLREVSGNEACRTAGVGTQMAKEMRRIALMGHVLDRAAGTKEPDSRAALAALLGSAPCYALTVAEGADLGAVASERVAGLLPSAPR